MNALALAISALQSLLELIPIGEEVQTLYTGIVTKLKAMQDSGADPTPDDWAALDAAVEALEAQLQAK